MRLSGITNKTILKEDIIDSMYNLDDNTLNSVIEKIEDYIGDQLDEALCHQAIKAIAKHNQLDVPLYETIFRYGSEAHLYTINLARKLYESELINVSENDIELLNSDIGTYDLFEGEKVPLDLPMITEAEYQGKTVELDKPKRGGSKAYHVYVKNPKTGKVIKVAFGSGMRAKINDSKARKAYDARHGCSKGKHNDKTKAGY